MRRQEPFRFERSACAALVLLAHIALVWIFIWPRAQAPDVDAALTAEPIVAMLLDKPRGLPLGSAPMRVDPPPITPKISWAPPVLDIALDEEPEAPLQLEDAPRQPALQPATQASTAAANTGTAADGWWGGGHSAAVVQRILPKYPAQSVRLGEEGVVIVRVQVNETGRVSDVQLAQGSGHQRLDRAAVAAVRRWKFLPAVQGSKPESSWGVTELRFVLYPFAFSRVAEQAADLIPDEQVKAGVAEVATAGGDAGLRRFIEDFSGAGFSGAPAGNASKELAKFRAALEEWGPVQAVEFKGAFGDHRWISHIIKPQYRTGATGDTVELRWDVYEVRHEHGTSLWRVALDRSGTVWAAQARAAPASR